MATHVPHLPSPHPSTPSESTAYKAVGGLLFAMSLLVAGTSTALYVGRRRRRGGE